MENLIPVAAFSQEHLRQCDFNQINIFIKNDPKLVMHVMFAAKSGSADPKIITHLLPGEMLYLAVLLPSSLCRCMICTS